jgi:transcriptional regulator with XRE-family HTH domain
MIAGDVLRAVRRTRRLSQRELAEHAHLPRSTIDRIESGRNGDPRLSTLESILAAAGYVLTVTNRFGRPLAMDDDHGDLRDEAGRRFPAHLPAYPVIGEMQDPWWGWRRIAWTRDDPRVPSHTYLQRRAPMYLDDYYADRRWDDAT